jgi:hypothetical protein
MALAQGIVRNRQAGEVELVTFRVLGSTVQAAPTEEQNIASIPEGFSQAVVSRSDTGLYTFTFNKPAKRPIVVAGVVASNDATNSNIAAKIRSETTNNVVEIRLILGTSTVDADFHITFLKFNRTQVY